MERKHDDRSLLVFDGMDFVGLVESHGASFAIREGEATRIWFGNQGEAIGWLVAEHRGIPLAERPARQFTE